MIEISGTYFNQSLIRKIKHSKMQRRTGSAKRGFVAPDLQEERDKLAFDQEELSVFFAGGEERANKWRGIVDAFGADP